MFSLHAQAFNLTVKKNQCPCDFQGKQISIGVLRGLTKDPIVSSAIWEENVFLFLLSLCVPAVGGCHRLLRGQQDLETVADVGLYGPRGDTGCDMLCK